MVKNLQQQTELVRRRKNVMADLKAAVDIMTTCIRNQKQFVRHSGRIGVHLCRCSNLSEVKAMVDVRGRWEFVPMEQVPAVNKPTIMACVTGIDWSKQGLMVLACDVPAVIAHDRFM